MTKTEIKVICIQVAGTNNSKLSSDTITETNMIVDRTKRYFEWITDGVEFCPHCNEEGLCDNEEDESGLYN